MNINVLIEIRNLKCVTPTQKFMLIMLATRMGAQEWAWPSFETWAEDCNMSARSIIRHLHGLVQKNLLIKDKSLHKSNAYRLNINEIRAQNRNKSYPQESSAPMTICHSAYDNLSPSPMTICHTKYKGEKEKEKKSDVSHFEKQQALEQEGIPPSEEPSDLWRPNGHQAKRVNGVTSVGNLLAKILDS